ncbi:MAG: CDP-alcohol phosphatidyltransferase family protein [Parcubacteria group bacterium]|nr:CDP-alcohol phosphatidyltransferase family protein [Parcubacteria group bacterium]
MKYTLKQILATRYDPGRSVSRKIEERLIPINAIGKLLAPYPAYLYLNLGLKPDHITFISFLFIGAAAYFFVIGNPLVAVISLLLFILHDSVDGDMARVRGASSYGAIMDSFGADIFYSVVPVSVGYYLFSLNVSVYALTPSSILFLSALTSISFLFYRLTNTKILTFFWDKGGKEKTSVFDDVSEAGSPPGLFVRLAKIYHHTLIKGNFFAEPGIVTWITILALLKQWEFLGGYMILILLYNLGYLVPNFARTYFSFLAYEKGVSREAGK